MKQALAQSVDLSSSIVGQLTIFGINVNNIFNWALGIGGLLALGIIIYGGILWTTAGGNESRIGDAKEWIKSAVFGLLLLFAGYLILNTINPALVGN